MLNTVLRLGGRKSTFFSIISFNFVLFCFVFQPISLQYGSDQMAIKYARLHKKRF